ncbi:16971_t:CDS:2, partial [Racocetra persica]
TALKLMDILEQIDQKPIEITNLMQRFTLDVLGKVCFGFDFNNLGDPNNVYVTTYNDVQKTLMNPFNYILPLELIPGIRQKNLRKINKLNSLFEGIIKEKHKALAAGKFRGDLLEVMLKANENQDNQMLSDTELRHNLAAFMLGGHETKKAREEVLRILGDNLIPSTEQYKSLKYLNTVPSLSWRKLTEDLKIKDLVIPAGTNIEVFIYGIQHSSKLWDNPEEFLPERFENEHMNIENNSNNSWFAFGGGPR